MSVIVFIANVEDGIIKVPKEYQAQLHNRSRVIVVHDEAAAETKESRKKRTFDAISITTKDLKFDKDEDNER